MMKINKRNLIIYSIGLAISMVLVGLYFINPENPWCVVSCSVGASGIGAVVLACFIEWSNEKTRADNRKNVRTTKLSTCISVATYLLEECITCYFKKRDKIRNIQKSDECHKITFDELWIEIQNQDKIIEQSQDSKMLEHLHKIDESLRRRCDLSKKHIGEQLIELKLFEAEGYFDTEEIKCINWAGECVSDTICVEDSLDIDSLKFAFEALFEIEEFQFLKNTPFYYKNRRTTCVVSNRYKTKKAKHITEEDIKSAISHFQRTQKDALLK